MTVTREQIVQQALSWKGTRWRHQGRNREGLDCIGLPVVICKALGIGNYDIQGYGREPKPQEFLYHFTNGGGTRINPADMQIGDVAVFHQRGYACHCGIISTMHGQRSVIHASMKDRMVIEELFMTDTPLVAVYRMPGVVA